jgi:predicted enzyme related to lactoylglutathione lyase
VGARGGHRTGTELLQERLRLFGDQTGWSLAEIDANGLNIGLNGREPEGAQAGGGPVVTFQPEAPLEAVVEDLEGKGVEFAAGISEHEWGRVATFKDSEGNDLQLYEPPSG